MSDDVLKCDLCKKSFSGVVPYSQHLKSAKHLKKKNQIELEATIKLPVTDEGKLCCTLCNMKFSGVIPFQQHMNGSTHMKNVRRQDVMKDICHNLNSNPKQAEFRTFKDKKKIDDDGYYSYSSGRTSVSGISINSSSSGSSYSGMNSSRPSTSNSYNPLIISKQSQSLSNLDPGIELQKQLYGFKSFDEQSNIFQKPKELFASNSGLWDSGFHSSGLPSTSMMNMPQVESKIQGCEICEIFSFNSQEEFIVHLQSDSHFIQKLKKMTLTNVK